jgi:hypothetical protein
MPSGEEHVNRLDAFVLLQGMQHFEGQQGAHAVAEHGERSGRHLVGQPGQQIIDMTRHRVDERLLHPAPVSGHLDGDDIDPRGQIPPEPVVDGRRGAGEGEAEQLQAISHRADLTPLVPAAAEPHPC